MKPFARYISEKWSREYKQSINCSNPKGFSQRAHCAGKRKRKLGEAVTPTARTQRNLESSMSAFMERVRHARRTHPVIRAWVLVEPEQHSGDRLVPHSSGKKPVHAWVEDATDSDHVYHYRGEYWWNPGRGDWWMRGHTRIHKSDARRDWERLQPVAAATGEWHDGVLTVLQSK